PELLRADPVAAQARALLRRIERTPPPVPAHNRVSVAVQNVLQANPHWIAELARRTGVTPIFEVA
ncbi:ribonuclease, partial [Pseudomonas sp. GW460-R15]|uniref:hypothetical protein n=1 Tax=Pseudomonas sp. GW460-R15 TaxID=2075557 RepID=UPI000CD390AD